jgi:multiple sugar transport system ATP-binding protein
MSPPGSASRGSTCCPPTCSAGAAGATQIGLRPEHIVKGGAWQAQVTRVEHLGDQTRLHLTLTDHPIVTLTDPHSPLRRATVMPVRAARSPVISTPQGARVRA